MLKYKTNKTLIISIFATINLSFNSHIAFGQIFNDSQNPLSVKWRQIDVKGFKIIYPTELEKEAQRMAYTLPSIYPAINGDLNKKSTTTPILFQNRGTLANGFVQLAPKKSEFFSTPPQNFDSQDWLNNLAVHELRHIAQFDKLTYNQEKPFPELVYFAYLGASIPTWFFEGDAVTNETILTKSGRGRQPSWIMPYRSALLEDKKFSYSAAYFGSNKNVSPGYYQLGYLTLANLKQNFGSSISDSLLSDISRRPIRLYPFSKSLKKFTGKNTNQYFTATQNFIQEKWKIQDQNLSTKNYESLNQKSTFATSYFLPVKTVENKIFALKESKAEARHFVLIDEQKKEHYLFGIGYQEQPWFSYKNNVLVWDEIRYDARYKNQSFSVICSYDFYTKKFKQISHQSRLFSPSLSEDGKKIIAVNAGLNNQFNLVEIDTESGTVLKSFSNPKNFILQTPSYDKTGKQITYISLSEKGKNLNLINNDINEILISNSRQQLSRPVWIDDKIFFNAHYNGIDNIYSIDIPTKNIKAISNAKYGAFNATATDKGKIIFNNYQINGYEIAEEKIEEQEVGKNSFINFLETSEQDNHKADVFENLQIPTTTFASKPYHQFNHLFNFHSVIPVIDNDYTYGLELQSDNLMNTLSLYTGIKYRSDLNRIDYHANLTYKALYPILSVLYRNRARRTFYNTKNGPIQGDWREHYTKLNLSVPLSFSVRNHNYSLSLNTATSYTQRYQPEQLPTGFIKTLNFPMEYSFTFNHSMRTAERDITPKWSQIFRLSYKNQPFDKNLKGEILALESFLYFPGLAKNHSFLASFNYQHAIGVNQYDQEISTVYGYNNILAKNKLQNTLLFNYRFPIAYPDWEIGPIAYIRNFRGGLFCHYENIGINTNLKQPKTYGLEIKTSLNLLRYQPVVDFGTRVVFVNKIYNQNPILEFSFSYNL